MAEQPRKRLRPLDRRGIDRLQQSVSVDGDFLVCAHPLLPVEIRAPRSAGGDFIAASSDLADAAQTFLISLQNLQRAQSQAEGADRRVQVVLGNFVIQPPARAILDNHAIDADSDEP